MRATTIEPLGDQGDGVTKAHRVKDVAAVPSGRAYLVGVAGVTTIGGGGCLGLPGGGGPSASPGTDSDPDWPVGGGDFDRPATAYAPGAAAPRSDPNERFRVELDGAATGRPTVAGGIAFGRR